MKYDHYNDDYDNDFDKYNDDHFSDEQVHTCVDVVFPKENTTDL